MLTFSHLPTFRGTPPDGVWHQCDEGARYISGTITALVLPNGRVYVTVPPSRTRHTHCCKTIDTAFAAAEAEVKAQAEFVRGVAVFEELRRRRVEEERDLLTFKWWAVYPGMTTRISPSDLDGARPVINPGMGGAGQKPTPTIQGNYRVVEVNDRGPKNEWYTFRHYTGWFHLLTSGSDYYTIHAVPGGFRATIGKDNSLHPTQHEAMAAVLAAAYPVDRGVVYVKEGEPRPDGWSMRVDKPGRWDFAIDNRLRGSAIRVTQSGKYVACGIKDASFAVVASAVERVARKSKETPEPDYVAVASLANLGHGDVIRHRSGGTAYTVIASYGDHVTAVATADVTNPCEWLVWREK